VIAKSYFLFTPCPDLSPEGRGKNNEGSFGLTGYLSREIRHEKNIGGR
jgi:hypothetical protein